MFAKFIDPVAKLTIAIGLALTLQTDANGTPPPQCQTDCVTTYGQILGVNNGVEARSNCSDLCINPTPVMTPAGDEPNPVYTGIGWQCVEYARRWLLHNHGLVFGSVDTAADMWNQVSSLTSPDQTVSRPVRRVENGSTAAPVVGDLIIYAAQADVSALRFGHVAVVVGVDQSSVKLAEQNWTNRTWAQEGFSRSLTLVDNGEGTVELTDPSAEHARILGWLTFEN
jgi:glutathionylspermidine amidase/synthetase